MEYNSKREELIIPEYGRHVQSLIRHARTIEDRNERQEFVEHVMGLMMQMHPQNRNLEDYKDKLWRHVFQIAEYNLDVTPPNGLNIQPGDHRKRPDRVGYPPKDTRFRHYGNNVQKLIAKAIEMNEGNKKDGFVHVIGSYMKLAYKTWNREHYVSDDIILEGLSKLSDGKLQMVDDVSLDNLSRGNVRQQRNNNMGGRQRPGGRDQQGKSSNKNRGGSDRGGRSGGSDNRMRGRRRK